MSKSRIRYLANNDTSREGVSRYRKPDMAPEMRKSSSAIYYVTLGLGQFSDINNPYQNIYLLFDTGSDLTWTQCEGCRNCFYQNSPYFPRTRSQTYQPYSCGQCPGGQCYQDHCTVTNSYVDGTTMNGILATETFTFSSPFLFDDIIHDLIFVCTIETSNFHAANVYDNPITGVLGMGKGDFSLISQLGRYGEYRFSYCLQDSNDHVGAYSQMMLSFGTEIGKTSIMSVTQILTNPKKPIFYYVDLIDISVHKRRLNIPHQYFTIQGDINNSGGTIFDSGSAISYLVSNAFDIFKTAIERYVGTHNTYLRRITNPNDYGFEACWEPIFDSATVTFPTITFHFGNDANMVVQPNQVISSIPTPGVPNPGLYCLFLSRSTNDVNVIGAFQQVNQRVITDVQTMQLSFAAEDCSQSTW
ncbi:aspartic proteinase nepenthesin-1-like [Silene latifolia]|uniref:aspartic proteinase nepenthesin-1-like n=1 Tax=Silene latifolia TaxID=37657 RepID=UPI003D780709